MELILDGRTGQFALAGAVVAMAWGCGGTESSRAGAGGEAEGSRPDASVRPGAEVLFSDSLHLIRGLRAGLVTNHTGRDREGTSTADLLHRHPEVELAALFSPEHGIRGTEEMEVTVEGGVDPRTGLPLHSLYGETRKPTPEMLEGVEVLLFDIQDIGARYYTYVSTMALSMEAAAEEGIPFVVLDRPNPVGGRLAQGNVLDLQHSSFVGMYPVAMRHGMTPGEMARLYDDIFDVGADLHVVPAAGWRRGTWYDGTGLPWVATSPSMPDLASATHYPGTCLFEGTNLSVGRGTEAPFRQVGAPWLDGEELARRLNEHGLAGVRFEAATFTPADPGDGKYGGEEVSGVRFVATDREAYDPTAAALAALVEARRMAGDRWEWRRTHFDRLAGTDRVREAVEAGEPFGAIRSRWGRQAEEFRELRREYLIYPE